MVFVINLTQAHVDDGSRQPLYDCRQKTITPFVILPWRVAGHAFCAPSVSGKSGRCGGFHI